MAVGVSGGRRAEGRKAAPCPVAPVPPASSSSMEHRSGPLSRDACVRVPDGMIISMTKRVKIAVSLPAELVDTARRCVASGRATSVSAYVAEALEHYARREDLLTYLHQSLEESGGPPSTEELAWADEILGR